MISIIPNILIIISLYAVMTIILYKTYISKSEEYIIEKNINYLVDGFLPNKYLLPDILKQAIIDSANNIKHENLKSQDDEATETNKNIINKTINKILIGFIIGILLSIIWCYYFNINFGQLFLNNTIIIIFILLIELAFFYIIRHKYIIADPNIIKNDLTNIIFP